MGLFSKFRKSKAVADDSLPPTEDLNEKSPDLTPQFNPLTLDAVDVMADMIYRNCWPEGWFTPPVDPSDWFDEVITGITLRSRFGSVRSCPSEHPGFRAFEEAIVRLNARIAIKLQSKAVDVAMKNYIDVNPEMHQLNIDADNRIQVLDTIEAIGSARKNQYAAFIREEGVLVVWADTVQNLIPTAKAIEASLVAFLWQDETDEYSSLPVLNKNGSPMSSRPTLSKSNSTYTIDSKLLTPGMTTPSVFGDKHEGQMPDQLPIPAEGEVDASADVEDPWKAEMIANRKIRPVTLISPVVSGLAVCLAIVLMCLGIKSLLVRYLYDGNAMRFALVAVLPPLMLMCAFPCSVLVSSLLSMFGPISQFHQNSAFYSAIPPSRDYVGDLMPITVQMPVYKESLEHVIMPTIESLKKAMTTFERQGGTVNVIICDDGLQLISEEDKARRIDYYAMNNIAHVARPPHEKDGFQRRGRFKKAGNLNYCNSLSLRIEDLMDEMRAERLAEEEKPMEMWSEGDDKKLYDEALANALEESEGRTWAAGNVRIGEIILLIDSDTRVPEDCFMDAALEMQQSPNVAIIQHASGVMQVANHFFENAMTFFTSMLQVSISLMVANGDVAPFVGHNAFLRWSAVQECAQIDPEDGVARVWSESHVSEDFQIALTLQSKGWMLRWATYSNLQFEEGVSLSAIDELARWQKYSYGCSEIVFNPLRYWFTRGGPFTKLFRTFLWSPIPPHAKWSILAYMFSYYALSLSWLLSLVNFVLIGSLAVQDTFYVSSWQVFFVCLLLFQGLNNVAVCILRYRLKLEGAGRIALQQFKWIPFFTIFFSGLSFKIACSLLAHLFSVNVSWTSTSKEVHKSNFFLQVPMIFKQFWGQILLSVGVLAGMTIATTSLLPHTFRVYSSEALVPVAITYTCHLIWPFVLDPYFTTFTFLPFHRSQQQTTMKVPGVVGTTNPDRVEAPVTFKAYLLCVFASFGGIFFGYDSGYINGVLGMKYFITLHTGLDPLTTASEQFTLPAWQKSLIVSVLSAGTFFGAVFAGDLSDWVGRRWTIISGCGIFMIGNILQTASSDGLGLIVAGRLISGVGVGFVSAIIILYMSEVAPRKVRGAIVSGYQFCITIGLLLAACVVYATQDRPDTGSYRIPIGVQFLWAMILATGLFFLPESPRWFVKKGRVDEAAAALARIRGQPADSDYITQELAEIIANHEYETELMPQGGYFASWAACFSGGLRNPASNLRKTILGTSIQMMQQLTGVNFIFYFGTSFFQDLGTISNPFLISLITTLVNVCSTPISFWTIEKFGRRPLLIYGAIGMFICEFICAIIGVTDGSNSNAVKGQIALICIYIFFFASTWGPGAWVVIGEIFPIPIRSRGVGLSTASNWLWNCILTVITPYLVGVDQANLGSRVFFLWGSTCVLCFVYAYFLIWETKGLTLEQVDRMMEETQSPRRSAGWRPHSTFAGEMGLTNVEGKALDQQNKAIDHHHGEKIESAV